jgi:signal transduction histidine kinase
MSVKQLPQILTDAAKENAPARQFLDVWPVIESILEAFSRATGLPIFVFFNDAYVFLSSYETLSPFCFHMLASAETANLCTGTLRSTSEEGYSAHERITMCHAGMLNGRREVETGFGTLTILFGTRKSTEEEARRRREQLIETLNTRASLLVEHLKEAAASDIDAGEFKPVDIALMDAIVDIVQRLVKASTGFRMVTINMAHELSLMLVNLGMLTTQVEELFTTYNTAPRSKEFANEILRLQKIVHTQCRLGLFIVRNFLSHSSEDSYNKVVKPQFRLISLEDVLRETTELYHLLATEKGLTIEYTVTGLPAIYGDSMEIRRLFHNVLNNALKYSYHSVPYANRVIRIRSKVPYDPGFNRRRFSITIENYGLGFTEKERRNVFKPGFRGKQAVAEVPIGSGIGLSEASKIMKLHKGEIRLQSKALYGDDEEHLTYLTTVDLIFPYPSGRVLI